MGNLPHETSKFDPLPLQSSVADHNKSFGVEVLDTSESVIPTFCVIVLVYNDLPHARKAVQSVLDQSDQNFELVIVDNGSTDSTHRLSIKYARDKRIRFVRMKRNQRSDAVQSIAETTKSKYVCFLFADDFYHPRRLETARVIFSKNVGAEYVFFNSRFADEFGNKLSSIPVTQFSGDIASLDRFGHLYHFLLFGNTLHPCGLVIKADIYRQLKGFPKVMHRIGDLTFFTRLLGTYEGVFSHQRMQSITVWRSGRNESNSNHVTTNEMIFERTAMLECWLEPGILNNLEKIFCKRQSEGVVLRARPERLWFLAHQVMKLRLPDYQIFGFRLLYLAAMDADQEFEASLFRCTGHTISEYITALASNAKVDYPKEAFKKRARNASLLQLLPSALHLEIGKLFCTIGAEKLGSRIYNEALARAR